MDKRKVTIEDLNDNSDIQITVEQRKELTKQVSDEQKFIDSQTTADPDDWHYDYCDMTDQEWEDIRNVILNETLRTYQDILRYIRDGKVIVEMTYHGYKAIPDPKNKDRLWVSIRSFIKMLSEFIRIPHKRNGNVYVKEYNANNCIEWTPIRYQDSGIDNICFFRHNAKDNESCQLSWLRNWIYPMKQMKIDRVKLNNLLNKIISYTNADFLTPSKDDFNLYVGYKPDQFDAEYEAAKYGYKPDDIEVNGNMFHSETMMKQGKKAYKIVLRHLYFLTQDKEEAIDFMKYLIWTIQNPYLRSRIITVLYGNQGTGKSALIKWFGEAVIGSHFTDTKIQPRFNIAYYAKKIIQFEEVIRTNGVNQFLKEFSTGGKFAYEAKGVDLFYARNLSNIFICCNNVIGLNGNIVIEQDDRRHYCIGTKQFGNDLNYIREQSMKFINGLFINEDYDQFGVDRNHYKREYVAQCFAYYCKRVDISDFDVSSLGRKKNKVKSMLINASKPPMRKFLEWCKSATKFVVSTTDKDENGKYIMIETPLVDKATFKSKDLYSLLSLYTQETGDDIKMKNGKVVSKQRFGTLMKMESSIVRMVKEDSKHGHEYMWV